MSYVNILKDGRSKLDEKSNKFVFVGYELDDLGIDSLIRINKSLFIVVMLYLLRIIPLRISTQLSNWLLIMS